MPPNPDDMDCVLRELILASAAMHPDDLPQRIAEAAERAGGTAVDILAVDLAQHELVPLLDGEHRQPLAVVGSPAGDCYRFTDVVRLIEPQGTRLWVPIMDSAERVGALGVTVADADPPTEPWEALGSLAGELLVSKERYGDRIPVRRRTRDTSLAAEMRWSLLPPLTFRSPQVAVTGILEPAYEIAGDTFDYAVNDGLVHLAILDAMGHGLEASRMANVAVLSYRHSRRLGLGLEDTAAELDRAVRECFSRSRYVTGQLATLDVRTRRFRMLNMGHPLPLLLRGGRVVGEVPSEPMLPAGWGAEPAAIYEAVLEPGDQVLMYTDGVTEARRTTEDLYGDARLISLLDSLLQTQAPPEEVLRVVIDDIMRFQDFRASDDATLVLTTLADGHPPGG